MQIRRIATAIAAASLMAGCAIHPVPEQVTGVSTSDIVKQIRCETRNGGRRIIFDMLKATAAAGDPYAQALVDRYSENQDLMAEIDPDRLDRVLPGRSLSHVRDAIKLIYVGAVAYAFELDMTETNNLGSTTTFLGAWQATLNMGLGTTANRVRENKRSFTITDTLGFLLGKLNSTNFGFNPYCDGHVAFGPNYIYPIAGKIGMYEAVYTFFQLAAFDGLSKTKADPGDIGAPVMTDELTFTTEFAALPTPKLTFVQVKTGFQVTDTALNGAFGRKDVHKVTVGLALAPNGPIALGQFRDWVYSSVAPGPAPGRRGTATTLVLNRITAVAATPAQQLAVQAVDQAKSREIELRIGRTQ